MYQYPYGDTQQLNLDWILTKIKELENAPGNIDMEDVANTLISATYDTATAYRRYDYCFYNGKLYRCLSDTTGAFNPADWQEALIGDDIPILTRLLNAVDAAVTSLQTTVGNQGNAITNLQTAIGDLDSDDVDNASSISGDSVTDALNKCVTNVKYDTGYLKKTINGADSNIIEVQDTPTEDSSKLPSSKAVYNTNAAVTALSTEVIGTISKSATITTGTIDSQLLRKVGNVVNISGRIYGMTGQNANDTFFTISENCRPNVQRKILCVLTTTANVQIVFFANVNPNGNIGIGYSSATQITEVLLIGTYPI